MFKSKVVAISYPRANGESKDAVPPGGTLPQDLLVHVVTACDMILYTMTASHATSSYQVLCYSMVVPMTLTFFEEYQTVITLSSKLNGDSFQFAQFVIRLFEEKDRKEGCFSVIDRIFQ